MDNAGRGEIIINFPVGLGRGVWLEQGGTSRGKLFPFSACLDLMDG